jgi:hypothetical protein
MRTKAPSLTPRSHRGGQICVLARSNGLLRCHKLGRSRTKGYCSYHRWLSRFGMPLTLAYWKPDGILQCLKARARGSSDEMIYQGERCIECGIGEDDNKDVVSDVLNHSRTWMLDRPLM